MQHSITETSQVAHCRVRKPTSASRYKRKRGASSVCSPSHPTPLKNRNKEPRHSHKERTPRWAAFMDFVQLSELHRIGIVSAFVYKKKKRITNPILKKMFQISYTINFNKIM